MARAMPPSDTDDCGTRRSRLCAHVRFPTCFQAGAGSAIPRLPHRLPSNTRIIEGAASMQGSVIGSQKEQDAC